MSMVKSEMLTVVATLLCLAMIACGDTGNQFDQEPNPEAQIRTSTLGLPATAAPVVSEATLPSLRVIHEGRTIESRRYEGCWTPASSTGFQCVESSPLGEQPSYTEVENGDSIEIEITPYSRPTKLMATMLTQPGEVMASGLLHLSVVERELVVDMPPGSYSVRVHAQWFEGGSRVHHKVNYVFGLTIPGDPELKGGCESTAIGGIMGIVLESLDDPLRTAVDPINSRGCRFNIPIEKVRLVLEGNAGHRYTETFHIDPPTLTIPLPVREDVSSTREGGPLPPGEYSRMIAVVAEDGTEHAIDLDDIGGIVKLADEMSDTDPPLQFPQHPDSRRTYTSALPEHIEGRLQVSRGCIYIRNGHIPVWPSDFSLRVDNDLVQVLDESGNVAAVDGREAFLAGYEVRADSPEGREISATLPLACPPGNFWIVGDEIGDLKEKAGRLIVPLEGSSLIFPRQSPGVWRDDLSLSTEGDLVHEGDCLRMNDLERHMIVWPPLFTPSMQNGVVEVRDGDGVTVVTVGDRREMTGFSSKLMRPHYVSTCPGPYWIVGRITERR